MLNMIQCLEFGPKWELEPVFGVKECWNKNQRMEL